MADSGDGKIFSVDIDELERGGVDIRHLGTVAASIFGDLANVLDKYGHTLGGDGDLGKSLEVNYYPAADASLSFLQGLRDLLDTHGGKTIGLGGFFGHVDTTATTVAGDPTGTGHIHH